MMNVLTLKSLAECRGTKNGVSLDTNVMKLICDGNSNLANALTCRLNLHDVKVMVNSKSIEEMEKLGYGQDVVYHHLSKYFSHVELMEITRDMLLTVSELRQKCPTLHSGDDEILAFTIMTNSVLITCDKGLLVAAKIQKVQSVNPNVIHTTYEIPNWNRIMVAN